MASITRRRFRGEDIAASVGAMEYELFIGDRAFSSWSLRGWLMLEKFGLSYRVHQVGLYTGTMADDLAGLAPARFVPVLRDDAGIVVGDSLAMAETLAERHPDRPFWPEDPGERALARWIVAEMHSSFTALRAACPMYLAHAWEGFEADADVRADLARIETLWSTALERSGTESGWLFGSYSLADVFYAPIALRIAAYGLPVGPVAAAYATRHLQDPAIAQWRSDGLPVGLDPAPYQQDLPQAPWPSRVVPRS